MIVTIGIECSVEEVTVAAVAADHVWTVVFASGQIDFAFASVSFRPRLVLDNHQYRSFGDYHWPICLPGVCRNRRKRNYVDIYRKHHLRQNYSNR